MFAVATIVPVVATGPVSADSPGAVTFDDAAAPTGDFAPIVDQALAASPQSRFVDVDAEELLADFATDDVTLELFYNVAVAFGRSGELSVGVSGDPTWSATTPSATATLTFGADGVRGTIRSDAASYSFVPISGPTHLVYEEGRTFPESEEPLIQPAASDRSAPATEDAAIDDAPAAPGDVTIAGDTPVIRILTVFDDAASSVFGGDAAAIAELSATIDEVNAAYARSGANVRMESAAIERVFDGPPMASSTALQTLRNPSDGRLDAIHARRDALGADLVALV